jgi:hypothetical protein
MTVKENVVEILDRLPEERLREVLEYVRLLEESTEREQWRKFGQAQLARAYGPDEPEYTLADLKPGLNP